MSIYTVKVGEGGFVREVPSADSHRAVVIGLVDLGTHEESYMGGPIKAVRKILVAFELDEADKAGSRFVLGKEYTLSSAELASLRKLMETLRGAKYESAEDMEVSRLIRYRDKDAKWVYSHAQAIVQVERTSKKTPQGERIYAHVKGVLKPLKGAEKLTPSRQPIIWEIGDGPFPAVDWLPWIYGESAKDKLGRSAEMAGHTPDTHTAPAGADAEDPEADIPF